MVNCKHTNIFEQQLIPANSFFINPRTRKHYMISLESISMDADWIHKEIQTYKLFHAF